MENNKDLVKKDYQSLVKHNNLIQGRYALEASEQKLLYKLFEHIQKNNYSTRELNLKFTDFYREFKSVQSKNITKEVFKDLVEGLQVKMPYIIKGENFIRTQWYKIIGKIDYSEIKLVLDEDVFQYIQAQEKNFTMLRLESLYSFKKFSTMRIYELIKQWSNTKKIIVFQLEDLKKELCMEDKSSYNNFSNFNRKVLEPAVKELNAESEIKLTYKAVKKGNKVTQIEFVILDIVPPFKYSKTVKSETDKIECKDIDKNISNETINIEKQESKSANDAQVLCKYPQETVLDKGALRMLQITFKGMDFTAEGNMDNYMAYCEAEAVTMSQDNVDIISMPQWGYFKSALSNKLEEIKVQRQKKNELNLEADLYGISSK